jgi:hypothetical protein
MSHQHETEQVANTGDLNSAEETSKLLVDAGTTQGLGGSSSGGNGNMSRLQKAQSYCCSTNGPTSGTTPNLITQQSLSATSSTKPMLIRQERTTSSYLASPQLSTLGTSEDTSDEDRTISYQLMPSAPNNRCRTCRNERRSSISPNSVICLTRSASKESVGRISPNPSGTIPPVYVTGSPSASAGSSSRIIRQSSQPESSSLACTKEVSCAHQAHQTSSLRQLKDPSDQISGIAGDVLRVNSLNLMSLYEI